MGQDYYTNETTKNRLEAYHSGMTTREWAEAIGVSYAHACYLARKHGLAFFRKPSLTKERNVELVAKVSQGTCTLREIGIQFGLSVERVRQIAKKQGVFSDRKGMVSSRLYKDKDNMIAICRHCGKKFNTYIGGKHFCSRLCRSRSKRTITGEMLWDGWVAWLRLGSLRKASRFAGISNRSGVTLNYWLHRWGIILGRGKSCRPRHAKKA